MPTFADVHSPFQLQDPGLPSLTPTGSGKHLPIPRPSQGPCPPLKGFFIPGLHKPSKGGPHLSELLPAEGVLTFLLKDYSSVYPSHLTCACDTPLPPSCFPAPPYSPLSRLSKLSASLNSPAVGEYGVEAGPSEVGVRGARAGGGLGAAPAEKREKSKGEREAEAGGQPAGFISLLY